MRGYKCFFAALAVASIGNWTGCGGSETPAPDVKTGAGTGAATAPADTTPTAQTAPVNVSVANLAEADAYVTTCGPQELLQQYLQAVKTQDAKMTHALLTGLARQRAQELNINVTPPGSETAQFEVGAVEHPGGDQTVAHVASLWMESDATGEMTELQSVWIMAQEENGWRIAGVVVKLFGDGQLPLVLNYEDPADVVQKLAMARDELTRLASLPDEPAANPGTPVAPAGFNGETAPRIDPAAGQPQYNSADTFPAAGDSYPQPQNPGFAPAPQYPPVYQADQSGQASPLRFPQQQ